MYDFIKLNIEQISKNGLFNNFGVFRSFEIKSF